MLLAKLLICCDISSTVILDTSNFALAAAPSDSSNHVPLRPGHVRSSPMRTHAFVSGHTSSPAAQEPHKLTSSAHAPVSVHTSKGEGHEPATTAVGSVEHNARRRASERATDVILTLII